MWSENSATPKQDEQSNSSTHSENTMFAPSPGVTKRVSSRTGKKKKKRPLPPPSMMEICVLFISAFAFGIGLGISGLSSNATWHQFLVLGGIYLCVFGY